jgi:hypothetical protein
MKPNILFIILMMHSSIPKIRLHTKTATIISHSFFYATKKMQNTLIFSAAAFACSRRLFNDFAKGVVQKEAPLSPSCEEAGCVGGLCLSPQPKAV